MTEQNLIRLSDAEIVIDQTSDCIYIDFKILSLKLEEVFERSKKLFSFFQKPIIFRFNGYYFEINKATTLKQIKNSYNEKENISHINYTSKVLHNATNRLEESNVKEIVEEVYEELLLSNPDSKSYKLYIRLYDQKQFASKLYRIYRQNRSSERNYYQLSMLEIPKILVKK